MKLTLVPVVFVLMGLLSGCSSGSSNGCVDLTLGTVQLSVPQRNMTPTTPHNDNSGNFIFAFDSSVPGIECPVGCNELFVTISSIHPTPEQNWIYREPKFTGQISGLYRIYHDRFSTPTPLVEILVPSDVTRPQDEFYVCDLEGSAINPLCHIKVVAKNGLVAEFSIPRKVLVRARIAASYVTQSIDQFSENHAKGMCK